MPYNPISSEFSKQVTRVIEERGANTPQLLFMLGAKISELLQSNMDEQYSTVLESYLMWCVEILEEANWTETIDIDIVETAEKISTKRLPMTLPECLAMLGMIRLKKQNVADGHSFLQRAYKLMDSDKFNFEEISRRNYLKVHGTLVTSYASSLNGQYEKEASGIIESFLKVLGESLLYQKKQKEDAVSLFIPHEIAITWPELPMLVEIMSHAAYRLFQYGHHGIALARLEELLKTVKDVIKKHASVATISEWKQVAKLVESNLDYCTALLHYSRNELEIAEAHASLALDTQCALANPSPYLLFGAMHILCSCALGQDKLDRLRVSLEGKMKKHPQKLRVYFDFALTIVYRNMKKPAKALEHLTQARDTCAKQYTAEHEHTPFVQSILYTLSAVYAATENKDYSESMKLFSQATDLIVEHELKQELSPVSPFSSLQVVMLMVQLSWIPQKKYDQAFEFLNHFYDKNRSPAWLTGTEPFAFHLMATLLELQGKSKEAETYMELALSAFQTRAPNHPYVARILTSTKNRTNETITALGKDIFSMEKQLASILDKKNVTQQQNDERTKFHYEIEALKRAHVALVRARNELVSELARRSCSAKQVDTCILV